MDDAEKLQLIEEMTANVDAVQERVLTEILARNAEAEYLVLGCGLAGATDRATFRAKVPLVTYEDMRPYIRRIADGDRSPILTGPGHPVTEFLISTGTSGGESKMVPIVEDDSHRRFQLPSLAAAVMKRYVPELDMGTALLFQFVRSETKTPGGLPARPALTSYYLSDQFRNRPRNACTSPTAAVLCTDLFQSMYAQMLCGLCLRHDVLRVGAVFASTVVRAIRFLQLNWEDLAADVEAGTLTHRVTDQPLREAVAGVLRRPDPELARVIRLECSNGDWAGIITRIWPRTKYLDAIITGSMAQYVQTLNHYSGGLPIVSTIYGSSESGLGINLRPLCDPSEVSYTIMPNMAYFEFLPVAATSSQEQLVELACVELGREYELVVTTYTGLCRYRVGDVLCVTGFYNATPQFRFVRRHNVLLSVDLDKTDEAELQRAVQRASDLLSQHGAAVADYTSRVCTSSVPGYYVIYWEVVAVDQLDGSVLDRCCLEMEEALSSMYRQIRVAEGSIGPLEIRVVRPGTFEELENYAVSRGASVGQYKVPRCVAAEGIVQLLDSHVMSSHSSTALPHWVADQLFHDSTPPDAISE